MPAPTEVIGDGDDGDGDGDEDVGGLEGVEAGGEAGAEDEPAGGDGVELGSDVGVGFGRGLRFGLNMPSCRAWNACSDLKPDLDAAFTECCMRIAEGSA